jgi:hypothetical protein
MAKKIRPLYFQHDCNAREDPKIVRLRIKHGSAGYGVYFMLLEYLFGQPDLMCEKIYDTIGYTLHESSELVRSVVEDFGLFQFSDDGRLFYSDSFTRRLTTMVSKADTRSKAAQKAAQSRWAVATTIPEPKNDANAMRTHTKSDANALRTHTETDANALQTHAKTMPIREDKKRIITAVNANAQARACVRTCEGMADELQADDSFWENAAMRFHRTEKELKTKVKPFVLETECRSKRHDSYEDFRRHFFDWLRIQLEKEERNGNNGNKQGGTVRSGGGTTSKADANREALEQWAARREEYLSGVGREEPDIL